MLKYLDASEDQAKTQIGTPYYLSPEICESKPYIISDKVIASMLSRKKYVLPIFRRMTGIYDSPLPRTHHSTLHQFHQDNRTKIFAKSSRPYNQTHLSNHERQRQRLASNSHHIFHTSRGSSYSILNDYLPDRL
mgnify:CR=1 FL=1